MATEALRSTKPGDTKYKSQPGPKVPTTQTSLQINELDASTAFVDKSNQKEPIKTSGVVTRGNGAATKGRTARGPLA